MKIEYFTTKKCGKIGNKKRNLIKYQRFCEVNISEEIDLNEWQNTIDGKLWYIVDSFSKKLDEALIDEAAAQDLLGNSNDYKEGVNSFLEKRKPVFKGI